MAGENLHHVWLLNRAVMAHILSVEGLSVTRLSFGGGMVPDVRRIFGDVVLLEIELWNALDARLRRDFELPLNHFEPMRVMDRLGPCRVYDIASELGITTGGASKLVDRIEANGLCRRRPNPEDRRSSLLELTAAGRALFEKAAAVFDEELERRIGSALPERTLEQFGSMLARLRSAGKGVKAADQTA